MALVGWISDSGSSVNHALLMYAAEHIPCLVIDCANAANPHAIFPEVPLEKMSQMYVVELELLYKFRDVLVQAHCFLKRLQAQHLIVTTPGHLFNYQDELENHNIIEQSWELMRALGKTYTVVVGVLRNSRHLSCAQKYCHSVEVFHGTHCAKPAYHGRYCHP
jgi:hypothetical protein